MRRPLSCRPGPHAARRPWSAEATVSQWAADQAAADLSANELKKILNDGGVNCDQEIDDLLEAFKKDLGENGSELLGRSSTRPGSAAENMLRDNWAAPRSGGTVE